MGIDGQRKTELPAISKEAGDDQTFAKKAESRASGVPSTTFDTGTRMLADANTKLTVRA